MSERRRRKKSETVEVRVEHELKDALMQRAQTEGRSASDIVRESIGAYLAEPEKETRTMLLLWKPAAALGVAGSALLWSALASSPAVAMPDLKAVFAAMDKNGDKNVTPEEFASHAQDHMVHVGHGPGPHHTPGVGTGAGAGKPFILPLRKHAGPPPAGAHAPPPEVLKSHFAEQDLDRNGSVDFEEFRTHHQRMMQMSFSAIDTNGDGSVDRGEYDAKLGAMPPAPGAPSFAEIDTDGDGKVSQTEFFPPG
jgi:hypothetical protein